LSFGKKKNRFILISENKSRLNWCASFLAVFLGIKAIFIAATIGENEWNALLFLIRKSPHNAMTSAFTKFVGKITKSFGKILINEILIAFCE